MSGTSDWFLFQDGPPVSYDVSTTISTWRRVDIDNVVSILRTLKGLVHKDQRAIQIEESLMQCGMLFDTRCCLSHVSQERYYRYKTLRVTNLPSATLPPELRTLHSEPFDGIHDRIDLVACWADNELAGHFFTLPENMLAKDDGVFVFTFPRRIVEELGTIDPRSGKIVLHPETRVLPVVPNLFRLFAAIHSSLPNEAFASGLYRFSMLQSDPVNETAGRLKLNFKTYVHLPTLRAYLTEGKQIPGRTALTSNIVGALTRAQHHQTYAGNDLVDRLRNLLIHPPTCPTAIQRGITDFLASQQSDLVPYPYQLSNLAWMCSVEKEIDEGIWAAKGLARMDREDVVPLYDDLGFSIEKKAFVKLDAENVEHRAGPATAQIAYELRGGALFDDAGLGKTVTCMLLAAWRGPRLPRADPTKPWSIFSDFGGTLIICPSQVCAQFEREIKRVAPSASVALMANKRHHEKLTYKDLISADFVIVSDNFITNGSYRKPLLGYHATDRGEAYDIVKTELDFRRRPGAPDIMNDNCAFLHAIHWTRLILDEVHFHLHHRERLSFIEKLHARYVWLSTGTPLGTSQAIHMSFTTEVLTYMRLLWKHDPTRIDYPSPHDIANKDSVLDAKRKRGQMATSLKQGLFYKDVIQRDMFDDFWTNAVVRHTKSSVENEIQLPPVVNHVIWCEFGSVERALYEHIASIYPNSFGLLAEACTHPHVNVQTANLRVVSNLDEVRSVMTAGIREELNEASILLAQQRGTVEHLRVRLSELGPIPSTSSFPSLLAMPSPLGPSVPDVEMEDGELMETEEDGGGTVVAPASLASRHSAIPQTRLQRIFNEESNALRKTEDHYNKLKRSLAFFEAAVDLLPDEKCSICLELIESENTEHKVGFTRCGHHFCYFCIMSWIRTKGSCPVCRTALVLSDALMLNLESSRSQTEQQPGQYEEDRQRYGSKMAEMLRYLRENANKKIVIFSQFDEVLRKTSKMLKSLNINYTTCYGNFAQRQHGIHTFKTDPICNLILLSTQFSSSGTNLTEASEVIFLDPIYRVDQRVRLETQALARVLRITQKSAVRFVKFLVRGTVEEEVWQRDHGEQ